MMDGHGREKGVGSTDALSARDLKDGAACERERKSVILFQFCTLRLCAEAAQEVPQSFGQRLLEGRLAPLDRVGFRAHRWKGCRDKGCPSGGRHIANGLGRDGGIGEV
jgi:hypothetical protein